MVLMELQQPQDSPQTSLAIDGTSPNSGILTASLSPLQGTGIITKGPYIRNCTNFIPDSIGARIDGFNADEGDQDKQNWCSRFIQR